MSSEKHEEVNFGRLGILWRLATATLFVIEGRQSFRRRSDAKKTDCRYFLVATVRRRLAGLPGAA
ncbi:MAG: hypothetical protein WA133_12430 [Syntrophales bacterium]